MAQTQNPAPVPNAPPQVNLPQRAPLNPSLPTIFIVGDSTASNGKDLGWGSHLGDYFDLTKVNVANRATQGEAAGATWTRALGQGTLAEIKPGDYVMLQWGQNDGGDLGGGKQKRAAICGATAMRRRM